MPRLRQKGAAALGKAMLEGINAGAEVAFSIAGCCVILAIFVVAACIFIGGGIFIMELLR